LGGFRKLTAGGDSAEDVSVGVIAKSVGWSASKISQPSPTSNDRVGWKSRVAYLSAGSEATPSGSDLAWSPPARLRRRLLSYRRSTSCRHPLRRRTRSVMPQGALLPTGVVFWPSDSPRHHVPTVTVAELSLRIWPNFRERRQREVRRTPLPRTRMNKGLVRSQGWFAFSKIHTMHGLLSSKYSLRP
jgi:hypothetical protein